jgi:hypothetical protein
MDIKLAAMPLQEDAKVRLRTDDYSNLIRALIGPLPSTRIPKLGSEFRMKKTAETASSKFLHRRLDVTGL